MSGGEFCLNCGTMIGDGSGHYTPCDCPGWEHTMIDTDTRATDGAAKIRKILNDIRGDELKRGTVVRASTTLRTCPSDMNRIEHHLNALAAQLAEAEARNHRLATALEREVNRTRRMQTRIPMTAAQIEEYHHLQPGDLDTSGEGTS